MALNPSQYREHVGRMFMQGIASALRNEEDLHTIRLRDVIGWIKDHRSDNGFPPAEDRAEAATRMLRDMFQRCMGRDSEAGPTNRRIFRKWIDGHLTYGDGITFEPQGQ